MRADRPEEAASVLCVDRDYRADPGLDRNTVLELKPYRKALDHFHQFPVAFSGGSSESCEPVPGLMLVTFARMRRPG